MPTPVNRESLNKSLEERYKTQKVGGAFDAKKATPDIFGQLEKIGLKQDLRRLEKKVLVLKEHNLKKVLYIFKDFLIKNISNKIIYYILVYGYIRFRFIYISYRLGI
jgi:hypothetical protein